MQGLKIIKLHPLPHEFGLRINYVPSFFSAGWIAGWEIGNAIRMKEKALRKGDIPITSWVGVTFIFSGAEMIGVGGKSSVTYLKRNEQLQGSGTENFPTIQRKKSESPKIIDRVKHRGVEFPSGQINSDGDNFELNFQIELFSLLSRLSFTDRGDELRDELLRNYMLFLAGLISEDELQRKFQNIREKASTGNYVSVFA
ncbi:hypothetical protein HRbin19_01282 [bacterium HR19]|nr:hypothetical protein HRbin19_01282 [bacterium HR19]